MRTSQLVHGDDDEILPCRPAVTGTPANGNGGISRQESRQEAAVLFGTSLEGAGLSRELAGRALGVSKPRVVAKCDPSRDDVPVTVADVLDLIAAGGRSLDAAEAVVRALQERIDQRRGMSLPQVGVEKMALLVMAVAGELSAASVMTGELTDEKRAEVRGLCARLHAQVSRLEACVREA